MFIHHLFPVIFFLLLVLALAVGPADAAKVKRYTLLPFSMIESTVKRWGEQYPSLLKVTTAQKRFGLQAAGGYKNYIMTIQDYIAHPVGSGSSKALPELLWSGALHGDERVGPTSVVQAAHLLLRSATCEALPKLKFKGTKHWPKQKKAAIACRKKLGSEGITKSRRQWLARLVATRRIVIVPTTNAMGYAKGKREENGYDPNRDFAYDIQNNNCMNTIAGRTLNELFRSHMFQISLTYHGGIEGIGFEWGSPSHGKKDSPDHLAQAQISKSTSYIGGSFKGSRAYQYGKMNDWLYAVRGGMEDWAYAGSWDKARMRQCSSKRYGGYPEWKTNYNGGVLRAVNLLIETSNSKKPSAISLGTNKNVLNHKTPGNGHVSRNIRTALLSADLVEPYAVINKVNGIRLSDDVVPLAKRGGRACKATKRLQVPASQQTVTFSWVVCGGITVDESKLWHAKWSDLPSAVNCLSQPDPSVIQNNMNAGTVTGKSSGITTRFAPNSRSKGRLTGSIDVSMYQPGDEIVVMASARLDKKWGDKLSSPAPNQAPQTHLANVRTDPNWSHTIAGKTIKGRLDWFSIPVTLVVGQQGGSQSTFEISKRL